MEPQPIVKLDRVLADVSKVGMDSSLFIYFVECHPRYDALLTRLFQHIHDGTITAAVSVLVITEVLVHPLRQGAVELANKYRDLLTQSSNLQLHSTDATIAEQAAALRARYAIRTPDALHLATAIRAGCQAFFTNDLHLKQVAELPVFVLNELVL